MELLALFGVFVFSIFGMIVCHALKAACQEASAIGEHLIRESQEAQAALEQAVRASAKPQGNEVIERVTYRMELKGR
jgi:hypothetical protein